MWPDQTRPDLGRQKREEGNWGAYACLLCTVWWCQACKSVEDIISLTSDGWKTVESARCMWHWVALRGTGEEGLHHGDTGRLGLESRCKLRQHYIRIAVPPLSGSVFLFPSSKFHQPSSSASARLTGFLSCKVPDLGPDAAFPPWLWPRSVQVWKGPVW